MSEQQNVLNTLTFSLQAINGEVLPSPVFRLVLDISYGDSVGSLAQGYYVKVNDSVHFVTQKAIRIVTIGQAERVFTFLNKTQASFTISVRQAQTRSGYQKIQIYGVNLETELYTLNAFKMYKGLWREIEGALYQNKSSEIAKFSGGKLDWVAELKPEYKLSFTQPSVISMNLFVTQGHLEVFRLVYDDVFAIPYYLYNKRRKVSLFNHTIEGEINVIPLGSQMRIINLLRETQVTSPDHEAITLPQNEYLLVHPIPRPQDAVD